MKGTPGPLIHGFIFHTVNTAAGITRRYRRQRFPRTRTRGGVSCGRSASDRIMTGQKMTKHSIHARNPALSQTGQEIEHYKSLKRQKKTTTRPRHRRQHHDALPPSRARRTSLPPITTLPPLPHNPPTENTDHVPHKKRQHVRRRARAPRARGILGRAVLDRRGGPAVPRVVPEL